APPGVELRPGDRGAPGTEGRVPRGDRVAPQLDRDGRPPPPRRAHVRLGLRALPPRRARAGGPSPVRLVSAALPEVVGVAPDLHPVAFVLPAENARACWIPPGFAHGFCVTSDFAEVEYKATAPYDPADELRILWSDPEIGIPWPVAEPVLSAKDRDARPARALM